MIDTKENIYKVDQLYHKYRETMYYIAYKILQDEFLAEDAVQQTFLKIFKNIDAIGEIFCHETKAYCIVSCKRVAIDMLRQKNREKFDSLDSCLMEQIPTGISVEEEVIFKINMRIIINKILQLPQLQKDILCLYYGGGSLKEIAIDLHISHEAAKKRLQRARKLLRFMLRNEGLLLLILLLT